MTPSPSKRPEEMSNAEWMLTAGKNLHSTGMKIGELIKTRYFQEPKKSEADRLTELRQEVSRLEAKEKLKRELEQLEKKERELTRRLAEA